MMKINLLCQVLFSILGIFISIGLINLNILYGQIDKPISDQNSNELPYKILLQNKTTNYYNDAIGYLVYPSVLNATDNGHKFPAVIMIHEWWGLNDNIKKTANKLSEEGYVVLAVDLYNGKVTNDQDRARDLSGIVRANPEEAITNLKAAVGFLSSLENVDKSRIASLGWCFGGGQSLQLALNSQQHPLNATIIYYGNLITDKQSLSKIHWPVLGIFGDKDTSIPVEQVNQFKNALDANEIVNEIYIYKDVGHAFANPSNENYAPKETADAWQKTLNFLNKYL